MKNFKLLEVGKVYYFPGFGFELILKIRKIGGNQFNYSNFDFKNTEICDSTLSLDTLKFFIELTEENIPLILSSEVKDDS
jgi:hypothetical protein